MPGAIGTPISQPPVTAGKLTVVEAARRQQAGQPAIVAGEAQTKPATQLNPLLQNTFIGSAIGALAGSGTALAVSHFLDDPLVGIHKAKVGGMQGAISGSVGALAAYWTPNRTAGTVVGGLAGAGAAVVQSLGTGGTSKFALITSAITGLVAGAAGGNVSVMLRDRHQAHLAKAAADAEDN